MGRPTEELRLPTVAVSARLARAGREAERVDLFVADAPRTSRAALAADVATLLENDAGFVPVRELDGPNAPRVSLLGKRSIIWVAIGLGDEDTDALSLFDHRHDVRVELDAAPLIAGHVLYSSPADRPRLIDHLNLPVQFLRVWTGDTLYLVSKVHVVRVLEVT